MNSTIRSNFKKESQIEPSKLSIQLDMKSVNRIAAYFVELNAIKLATPTKICHPNPFPRKQQ